MASRSTDGFFDTSTTVASNPSSRSPVATAWATRSVFPNMDSSATSARAVDPSLITRSSSSVMASLAPRSRVNTGLASPGSGHKVPWGRGGLGTRLAVMERRRDRDCDRAEEVGPVSNMYFSWMPFPSEGDDAAARPGVRREIVLDPVRRPRDAGGRHRADDARAARDRLARDDAPDGDLHACRRDPAGAPPRAGARPGRAAATHGPSGAGCARAAPGSAADRTPRAGARDQGPSQRRPRPPARCTRSH